MRDAGFFNKQRRFSYVNDHSSIPGRSSSSGTCSTHRFPYERGMLDTQRRFSYVRWTFRGVATWRSRFRRRGLFHVKIRLERTGLFIIMYYASNQPLNSELVASLRLASVRLLDAGHAASGCPRARVSLAAGKNPAWEVYFLFWTPDSEKQRTGGLSRLHFTLFLVLVGSFAHMQSEGKSVKVVSLATPLILQNFLDVKVQGTADP